MADKKSVARILMYSLVRAKGIEPSSKAWEAFVLPLYHTRKQLDATRLYHKSPEDYL